VLQGLTLAPLVRLLKLDGEDGLGDELLAVRADLASAALALIGNQRGPAADYWRYGYETAQAALSAGGDMRALDEKRTIGLAAIRHQRERLETLRAEDRVSADVFMVVQEELDFREVALSSEEDRQIEES
jgi:monovalent cation/hydrogen antiporter